MKKILTAGLLFLLTIISSQCRKNDSTYNGTGGSTNINKAPITATLQGNITDETGQPSSGVTITIGDKTATTDNNGYFRITAAALDKNASFVLAQKPGYFNAYRSFSANSGTNQIAIQLIKKVLSGSVSASSGGTITLSNGAKIALPANGVVNASSNAAYSGTINVYAAYIDPSDNNIAKTISGSFMANDKNNKRVTLASYGMLAVELQSSDGQKLQIATSNTATLTTPIPASLQSKAPATISMWYMNEQTGLWQEEGSATKSGATYVGTVKHFSFWNCDYPFPTAQFSATLKTSDGLPLIYGYVVLRYTDTSAYSYGAGGYTDSLGVVSGLVPNNANLVLQVVNQCNNVIYSKNIGIISSNTDLGILTIPSTVVGLATITGKLVTCNNTPVSNGYAVVSYQYYTHYVQCNSNGDFSTNFIDCSSSSNKTCQILGVDGGSGLQGNTIIVPLTIPNTNVGNITACGVRTPYYITIKGKLLDCNNAPVSNGTIDIQYNPEVYTNCDALGNFTTKLLYNPDSSTNCQITGTNLTAQLRGNPITINIASILKDTLADVGNIIACGNKVNVPYNITLIGKVVDCNNIPVSIGGGYINFNGGQNSNRNIYLNSSGDFSVLIYYDPSTNPSCQITGVNTSTKQQGSSNVISIASILNGNTANAGNITACGTSAASNITYSIDGKDSSLLTLTSNFGAYSYQGFTNIYGYGYNRGGINFSFSDNLMTTGTFPLSDLTISGYSVIKLSQPFNTLITNFPQNIGDNFEGSFSGQFTDSLDINHTVHTIICSFKQPRTY